MKSPKKQLWKNQNKWTYITISIDFLFEILKSKKNVYDIWSYQTCNGLSIYISNNISVSVIHHHSSSGLEWQVPVVLWLLLFFFLENYLLHKNVGRHLELPIWLRHSLSDRSSEKMLLHFFELLGFSIFDDTIIVIHQLVGY